MAQKSKKHLPAVRPATPSALIGDIRRMIEETRSAVAMTINASLTMLYWRLGRRIQQETLRGKRAGYGEDFHLDLLLLHRKLRRLVAVELKLGKFKAEYKGKMELYLRWLEENEMQPGEEPTLGLILCAEGNREQIQLLRLDASGIHVAEYLTELPPKDVLKKKLHVAVQQAKAQLEHRGKPAEEPGHGE